MPSGISASQFTRWHLDHHAELGSDEDDPKRHHLSPKSNARWFKLLYCVAGAVSDLFPRRAEGERDLSRGDAAADRGRAQGVDRGALAVLAAIWIFAGGAAALRAYVIPVFFVFPIAFTLNRLGQHYDIDPTIRPSGAR